VGDIYGSTRLDKLVESLLQNGGAVVDKGLQLDHARHRVDGRDLASRSGVEMRIGLGEDIDGVANGAATGLIPRGLEKEGQWLVSHKGSIWHIGSYGTDLSESLAAAIDDLGRLRVVDAVLAGSDAHDGALEKVRKHG